MYHGENMMLDSFAIYQTTFGLFKIYYESDKIVAIDKLEIMPSDSGVKTLLTDKTFYELTEYFAGKRKSFDIPYKLDGTNFQKKVWNELTKIPYGETRTYKQIAQAIGNEKACRAVGMANNKNPLPIIVPCHRVIGSGGKLVGYGFGLEMKEALLKLETQVFASSFEVNHIECCELRVEKKYKLPIKNRRIAI